MKKAVFVVKQDINYHTAINYLNLIKYMDIMKDEKFKEIFKPLLDYLKSRLEVPEMTEIINKYICIEYLKK